MIEILVLNFPLLIFLYVFTSCLLLKYPLFFLKNNKKFKNQLFLDAIAGKKVLKIAHRGGSRENLENTMQAFRHAKNLGIDMLEMDVLLTKDKQVVICHDKILDRLCDKKFDINQLNYSDLPQHQDQVPLHFAHNQHFNSLQSETKYFPLLEEVFQEFPDMLINVELKYPTSVLIFKVCELIEKYNREEKTIWGVRNLTETNKLILANKNIPIFFTVERILLTYFYYVIGVLPFIYIKEDSIQVPLLTDEYRKWKLQDAKGTFKKLAVNAELTMISSLNYVSRPLFQHLNKRGLLVIYWVINDVDGFTSALDQNVNGIMTDNPTLLMKYIQSVKRD